MGSSIPINSSLVAYPVEGSKQKGFSAIYRNPRFVNKLLTYPDFKSTSVKDVFLKVSNTYQNNDCIGQIKLKTSQIDGKSVQQRTVTKYTYGQVKGMAEKIGSFLYQNGMFYEEPLQQMKLMGIFSKNRYEWMLVDIACILYGFTSVPLYETLGIENLQYCIEHSGITTLFVTAGTLNNILSLKSIAKLQNIISFQKLPSQIQQKLKQKQLKFYYLQDILNNSNQVIVNHNAIIPKAKDCFTFSYTSGTTGPPKCAMISHLNMISVFTAISQHSSGGYNKDDIYVSFLPLPHLLQRDIVYTLFSVGACVIFYCGDTLKVKDDMSYVRPTVFVAVPRILNRIVEGVEQKFNQLSGLKSCLVQSAVQSKISQIRQNGSQKSFLYDALVFDKAKQAFGGRIRFILAGSAPIKRNTSEMIKIIMGCPLYECYGQTQSSGLGTEQEDNNKQIGHVGGPAAVLQFKLCDIPQMNYTSEDKNQQGKSTPRGQIWFRGDAVFMGYYKDAQKTKQTLTQDGWLKTGDVGMLLPNSNALTIIDRRKNIFKLQQGQYVASQKVQNIYCKSDLVSECFLYGDSTQNYAVAVIVPKKQTLVKIAQKNSIQTKQYTELCNNKKIGQIVCKELDSIGKSSGLMSFEQAKHVYLEPEPFMNRGIVSTTMKLQRFQAKKYYENAIKQMYKQGPIIVSKKQ